MLLFHKLAVTFCKYQWHYSPISVQVLMLFSTYLPGAESLLKSLSRNFPPFMEPKHSLPCYVITISFQQINKQNTGPVKHLQQARNIEHDQNYQIR
jgi:hypothetical protein